MAGHAAQGRTAWYHEEVRLAEEADEAFHRPPWHLTAEQLRVLDEQTRELELLYGPFALGEPDDGSDRGPVRESRASGANAEPCFLRPAATTPDASNVYPETPGASKVASTVVTNTADPPTEELMPTPTAAAQEPGEPTAATQAPPSWGTFLIGIVLGKHYLN